VIDFELPVSFQTCTDRLHNDLAKRAEDLKTGRGGLTYHITEKTNDTIHVEMDYRINWLIGAGLRGTLTGDTDHTKVSGKVHTHIGVYLTIAVLNLTSIAAIFINEAGLVALMAALGISALITFLVVGIRQGLADAFKEAITTPQHLLPSTPRRTRT